MFLQFIFFNVFKQPQHLVLFWLKNVCPKVVEATFMLIGLRKNYCIFKFKKLPRFLVVYVPKDYK